MISLITLIFFCFITTNPAFCENSLFIAEITPKFEIIKVTKISYFPKNATIINNNEYCYNSEDRFLEITNKPESIIIKSFLADFPRGCHKIKDNEWLFFTLSSIGKYSETGKILKLFKEKEKEILLFATLIFKDKILASYYNINPNIKLYDSNFKEIWGISFKARFLSETPNKTIIALSDSLESIIEISPEGKLLNKKKLSIDLSAIVKINSSEYLGINKNKLYLLNKSTTPYKEAINHFESIDISPMQTNGNYLIFGITDLSNLKNKIEFKFI